MGTAAVHSGLGKIYVGLGGYSGVAGFDKTPFIRALNWNTLADAWPTTLGPDNVTRYSAASPPLYTSSEAGLSSPAVVNDVVFVSTHKIGFYALDANTGLCLWAAPSLPSGGWPYYCLGPAIYGNYVVIGAREDIRIYKLPGPFIFRVLPELEIWRIPPEWLQPRPEPPPIPPRDRPE
jgi:outer membrane protein assembly factor BamB